MNCLFCCDPDTDDKPESSKDFICSLCVQILISATQEELKRAHTKAIEKGYARKAKAIKSFLIEGMVNNDRETKTIRRNLVRERIMREVRPTRDQLRSQPTTVELD